MRGPLVKKMPMFFVQKLEKRLKFSTLKSLGLIIYGSVYMGMPFHSMDMVPNIALRTNIIIFQCLTLGSRM